MSAMFLSSCYDFFLIKWIADLLGMILNLIYNFLDVVGIHNIGLCIILFTFITKMLMLPMSIKQQKFTKLSSVMSPELQAIQKKYKGKSDNDSMMKMQAETRAVYDKYGASPAGGCGQMLIQMPIIFALYAIISCIPNHVTDIHEIYLNKDNTGIVDIVYNDATDINKLEDIYKLVTDYETNKDTEGFTYGYAGIDTYLQNYDFTLDKNVVKNKLYKNLTSVNYSESNMKMVEDMYEQVMNMLTDMENMSMEKWDNLKASLDEKANSATDDIEAIKYRTTKNAIEEYLTKGFSNIKSEYQVSLSHIDNAKEKISDNYDFLGINLSKSPRNDVMIALLIPLLSALTQWLSMNMTSKSQNSASNSVDNPMASSMKVMSITMPLVSAFFCYSLPAGLGLYWVCQAVFQIIQQIFINIYFNKTDVQDIIEDSVKKANKKRAKKGQAPIAAGTGTISNAAKSNTKNIAYNTPVKEEVIDMKEPETNAEPKKKGSIAARANMVKEFNERNK